jgi:hypothetical protein
VLYDLNEKSVSKRLAIRFNCKRQLDRLMLEYLRMLVSLIEARSVSRAEILEMLQRVLRQHSLGRRRRIDHAVNWLQEHPP